MRPSVFNTAALVVAFSVSLPAQRSGPVGADAQRAARRLQALHDEADRLAGEARTLLGDLRQLEIDRQIAGEELRRVSADAEAVAAELAALDREVQRLESANRAELPGLRQRLVDVYKLGAARYARLLLGATELRRIAHASRTVAMLARSDRDRVEARRRRLDALRAARERLEERGDRLARLRAEARHAQAAAARAVRERGALLREIDRRRDLTAQLAGELQTARDRLQRTRGGAGAAGGAAGLPMGPFRGDLMWPAAGEVRQAFGGLPDRPLAASSNGIEIAAAEGTPVRAVHDGRVVFADSFMGFGRLVIVQHDGRNVTLYGHLLEVAVASGDRVAAGARLGSSGSSPTGTAGLYFELRIDAKPVDPLQWLEKR